MVGEPLRALGKHTIRVQLADMSWNWTHTYRIGERLPGYYALQNHNLALTFEIVGKIAVSNFHHSIDPMH